MIVAGIDPSFSRTGIAIIDTDRKLVSFKRVSRKCGKTWGNVVLSADALAEEIGKTLSESCVQKVFIEEPIPRCMVSGALWCLGCAIYERIKKFDVSYFHPSSLLRFHGKKGDKTASLDATSAILSYIQENGYKVSFSTDRSSLVHDEAEGFIYAVCGIINEFSKKEEEEIEEWMRCWKDVEMVFAEKYNFDLNVHRICDIQLAETEETERNKRKEKKRRKNQRREEENKRK